MLIEISNEIINRVKEEAHSSPRKRKNYNFHKSPEDPINRMLQVMNRGTYVQPHRHKDPDKREIFILLAGKIAVFEFGSEGQVLQYTILDTSGGTYGVEIPIDTWHTLIALEDDCVLYEIKDGPYRAANDKDFASWAPSEMDPEQVRNQYLDALLQELHKQP